MFYRIGKKTKICVFLRKVTYFLMNLWANWHKFLDFPLKSRKKPTDKKRLSVIF